MSTGSSALRTAAVVVGGTAAALALAWPLGVWWEVRKCEKPKYTVLKSIERTMGSSLFGLLKQNVVVEIRRYAPQLIAEVTVDDAKDMKEASSTGFRLIASFIFGNNESGGEGQSEKVAMTSPVTVSMASLTPEEKKMQTKGAGEKVAMTSPVVMELKGGAEAAGEASADKKHVIAFVMPSKYTKDTLPKPKSDKVAIKEIPAHTLASISWRGKPPREAEIAAKKAALLEVLRAEGIEVVEPDTVRVYQYYPPFTPAWMRYQEVLLAVKHA